MLFKNILHVSVLLLSMQTFPAVKASLPKQYTTINDNTLIPKRLWAESMINLGSHIISSLNDNPELLQLPVSQMLEELGALGKFNKYILPGLRLGKRSQKMLEAADPLQQDYITIIAAVLWAITYKSSGEPFVRGAFTIQDQDHILLRFLFKYCLFITDPETIQHCETSPIQMLTSHVFSRITAVQNPFVYHRNGVSSIFRIPRSSHMSHPALNAMQLGIDMRISTNIPALQILPFDYINGCTNNFRPSHLLLGTFQGEEFIANYTNICTFIKFERIGLGSIFDAKWHFKNWLFFVHEGRAKINPKENHRETALLNEIATEISMKEKDLKITSDPTAPLWIRLQVIKFEDPDIGRILKESFTEKFKKGFNPNHPEDDVDLKSRQGNERQISSETFRAIKPLVNFGDRLEEIFQKGLVIKHVYQ